MRYVLILLVAVLVGSFSIKEHSVESFYSPEKEVKNVILLIGDGMGLSQVSAGIYNRTKINVLEDFPVIGFQKTYSLNNLITDSAASATAIATGHKTTNNSIGVDSVGKPFTTIIELAEEKGLSTGLIATSSIVHATPASFVAHEKSRNFYEDIALDFLDIEIDFFVGGGKQFFDRRKKDDRDLIEELKKKQYNIYDYFSDDIRAVRPSLNKNFGFFTADNQPVSAIQGRDYLPVATDMALDYLPQKSDKGFFVVIEGSQIDWSGHANQANPLLAEVKDFNRAVRLALNFAKNDGETLVIVTADHETGGAAINPGSKLKNLNIVFTTNGHTGTMVPVFAYGPGAEEFGGIYENTELFFKMKKLLRFQ